jgi:uncharacterized protein
VPQAFAAAQALLPPAAAVVLLKDPDAARLETLAPFTAGYGMIDGAATAYVCRDFVCQLPVTDPAALREALAAPVP